MIRRRPLLLIAISAAVGLGCVRLGFWQLSRLAERRASNAIVAARLDSAATIAGAIPADTALARFRRVVLTGTFDYPHELVLAGRGRNGSPGINFMTPLRIPGRDTAILVNRGWVYAPDAMIVESARWREPDPVDLVGFVNTFPEVSVADPVVAEQPRTLRSLDLASVRAALPYPIASYYVVATTPAVGPVDSVPARLAPPALDEGPHMSYAIQWFSFALIALGGGLILWRSGRDTTGERVVPPAPELPR